MRSGSTTRSKTTQLLEAIQEVQNDGGDDHLPDLNDVDHDDDDDDDQGQSAMQLLDRTQGQLSFSSTMETTVSWTAWALLPLERWVVGHGKRKLGIQSHDKLIHLKCTIILLTTFARRCR